MAEPSKFAENQFLSSTNGRIGLMGEVLADTMPRLLAAQIANAGFTSISSTLNNIVGLWNSAETVRANAEAGLPAATYSLTDKLASLTRKPDADNNSILESWDAIIRAVIAYQSPAYIQLLPHGRDTLTDGTIDAQIDAGRDFGLRCSAVVGKPTVIAMGVIVTAFYTAARAFRNAQTTAKAAIDSSLITLEALRLQAAAGLYAMVGTGMTLWSLTPERVDTLFDVSLLRGPIQEIPAAPADTTWTPATRLLATTALPSGATRLEAWRQGPGGMPELLAIGETDTPSVEIPAAITFDPGDLYDLWLQARNSRGTSPAGPKQSWTAV